MKFTSLQSNFSKALNQVSRVVGTRTTLPVLGNILITAEKGKIRLSATDLEVAITSSALGKVEEEGRLTIPARLLSDFVTNNKDESIEFSTKNENSIHLKSAHFEANISGISAEEFPSIPDLPKDNFCSVNIADFSSAIKKVLIAPANDETRPVLAGILFQFNGKDLTLAATDSYRLAEKKLTLEKEVADKKFIVPARTMNEVLRLSGSADITTNISISSTENQIAFKIGDIEVVSRLIEGAFPNYSQIIPSSSKIKSTIDTSDFAGAVKMSALFAKNAANNIKIKIEEKTISISSSASETGDSVSTIDAQNSGGSLEIAFNAKYIADVLQVTSDEKVTLELNDENSSGLIRGIKDPSFTYIVMPLRVDA